MRTATTKVRRETYERFRAVCQEMETTPYAVLQDFLLAFLEHFEAVVGKPDSGGGCG